MHKISIVVTLNLSKCACAPYETFIGKQICDIVCLSQDGLRIKQNTYWHMPSQQVLLKVEISENKYNTYYCAILLLLSSHHSRCAE